MNEINLATPIDTLEQNLIEEDNLNELNEIIDIFNVNLKKKDIVRSKKLSEIQDKVVEQLYERVDKRADEFSNNDLLQFHKIVQDSLNKADNTLENIKTPTIQVNQQINVGADKFDRDSRERIISAVNAIISGNYSTEETKMEENINNE